MASYEERAKKRYANSPKGDLSRGGKNAMPMPPLRKMTPRQDLNAINPDAPGVMDSMHHALPDTQEDI